MVNLFNKETEEYIGAISEEQLQYLIDQLEEESSDDMDYYINIPTIEFFQENGADAGLIEILKKALGDKEDVEIRYEKV